MLARSLDHYENRFTTFTRDDDRFSRLEDFSVRQISESSDDFGFSRNRDDRLIASGLFQMKSAEFLIPPQNYSPQFFRDPTSRCHRDKKKRRHSKFSSHRED